MTTQTTEWAGPSRFLPPGEPIRRNDGGLHFSGLTYAVVFGYRPLQLDVLVPAGADAPPLVVWLHGGGWMFGDRRELPDPLVPLRVFERLLAAGLAVASVDYRLALEAPFPAQLHDVKAAIRYVRAFAGELGISAERIGVMGESAGGHLAALTGLTAHRPDLEGAAGVVGPSSVVDAVVDWYGIADFGTLPRVGPPPQLAAKFPPELLRPLGEDLLAGLDGAARADASPVTHVTPAAPPILLVHGTADGLVPFAQSEQLGAALEAAGAPVRLVPVEGADHVFGGHDGLEALVDLSVGFLADTLLAPETERHVPVLP